MSTKTKLRIFGMTLTAIGIVIVGYHSGIWPAVGLFIFAWGNNIEQSIKRV